MESRPSTSTFGSKRHLENEETKCNQNRNCKRICIEKQRSGVPFNFSEISDEETFINNINNMIKYPVDLQCIEKLCSSGQFNQLQPNTTQMIANLTSQPYIGLMEHKKLLLLLEFLLKLHKSGNLSSDVKFQEKSKTWSVTQLKKFLCFPLTVLKEKDYIYPMTLQTAVTKLVSNIAKEIYNGKNLKIPIEIIQLLCSVSDVMVQMPMKPSDIFIESILSILYEVNLELPVIKETVQRIGDYIFKEYKSECSISAKALGQLYILNPLLLEETICNLLKEEKCNPNFKLNECKLPEASSYHQVLFQKVINMLISAWLQSNGNKEIIHFMSKFVYSVQNYNNNELMSLFPENLWPIVLLLQIPATDIPLDLQNSHVLSINNILCKMIRKKTCSVQEIIILLLIFPSWYAALRNKEIVEDNCALALI